MTLAAAPYVMAQSADHAEIMEAPAVKEERQKTKHVETS
jgi:hypothetical protein